MKIPEFKYHPDPIKTGAFSQGEYRKCDCCNESTNIWYSKPFYTAKMENFRIRKVQIVFLILTN